MGLLIVTGGVQQACSQNTCSTYLTINYEESTTEIERLLDGLVAQKSYINLHDQVTVVFCRPSIAC